jgi:hypothetical protein
MTARIAKKRWSHDLMESVVTRVDGYIEAHAAEVAFSKIKDPYRTKAEVAAMRAALSYRKEALAIAACEWAVEAGLLPSNGMKRGRR